MRPPKFQLLPQTEEVFTYNLKSGEPSKNQEDGREIIFLGVRPCDASAIKVLDKILLEGKFQDPIYSSRRRRSLIISIACEKFAPQCFCKDVGAGPVEGFGGDISMMSDMDRFYVKATSMQGLRFIDLHRDIFHPASKAELDSYIRKRSSIEDRMRTTIDINASAQKLKDAYEDLLWSRLSETCIGCAICSFFCPTCYCFDVFDHSKGSSCTRFRGWDSCSFCDFSKMAGGLDPRPTKDKRFRHRIFHKAIYVPETFGVNACVGCGRCISICPSSIDIREVLRSCL
ncbi:MAG: 4Fe-4S dicluster domain-containing protein [Thermoproteota archaeon]